MRADAVKNRARILEAAEEIFATEGVSVPIDTVAERAGLGVGTLYRHFPTKEALFEAIVVDRLEQLLETVRTQRGGTRSRARHCSRFWANSPATHRPRRTFSTPWARPGSTSSRSCFEMMDEMKRNIDVLRQRAVDAGAVRGPTSRPMRWSAWSSGPARSSVHAGADDARFSA